MCRRARASASGPEGEAWERPGNDAGLLEGSALNFAPVVTQCRVPSDTRLVASGESALAWLPIAQCFASAPQDPASMGSRQPIG